MNSSLFLATYRNNKGASAVELAMVVAIVVVGLWIPLKALLLTYQGDAVVVQEINSAYKTLAGQSFEISEMGPDAYLRPRTTGDVQEALRSISSKLFLMTDVEGYCAIALEANSSGTVVDFENRDRSNNPCPGYSLPPNIEAAFQAAVNPYAGRQFAVAAFNSTPGLDREFALYRASTLPNSNQ